MTAETFSTGHAADEPPVAFEPSIATEMPEPSETPSPSGALEPSGTPDDLHRKPLTKRRLLFRGLAVAAFGLLLLVVG
ncbi:MAG: hypothetical protein HQ518_00885, partial [Rhodopirellula sp.]|nr:hypothetical protein [Rhodopirellula sp.]